MEDLVEYDLRKWKMIMGTTQSNYSNMVERLTRRSKVSNLALVYYSIILIVFTLTSNYFASIFNSHLAEYFSILLSIILLAYSLINNNSNYNIRIVNIENSLNKIKDIKRKISEDNLEKCIDEYNEVTKKTERREDVDFYITVRNLCEEYNIPISHRNRVACNLIRTNKEIDNEKKAVVGYLSEINVIYIKIKIFIEYFWYSILLAIPVLAFIICFL